MKKFVFVAFLLGLFSSACAVAADSAADSNEDEAATNIREKLLLVLPRVQPDSIRPAGFANLYEVTIGTKIIYITADARHLVQGKVIDLETRTPVTERRLQELKQASLASLDESDMIIYGDKDLKHTVTVFTDIDCGYCRKLHSEMDDYLAKGIRVRYLAYPRAGLNSQSAKDAISVWCADDQHAAMDAAKSGGSIEARDCENPVAKHYQLGRDFGISGTPALLMEDGEVIPGYVPAARLARALDKQSEQAAK